MSAYVRVMLVARTERRHLVLVLNKALRTVGALRQGLHDLERAGGARVVQCRVAILINGAEVRADRLLLKQLLAERSVSVGRCLVECGYRFGNSRSSVVRRSHRDRWDTNFLILSSRWLHHTSLVLWCLAAAAVVATAAALARLWLLTDVL